MSEEQVDANAIDTSAIAWVSRLDLGELEPEARAELDAWILQDIRHKGAFLRARAAWKGLDRLQILPSDEPIVRRWWEHPVSRRRALVGGGMAVLGATAAATVAFVWHTGYWGFGRRSGPAHDPDQSSVGLIETPLGEIRRVPLSDGSLVAVNTDSSVKVSVDDNARAISLDRGELWLEVAKDPSRPFIVSAGNVRVRAVGTAFSVRRRNDGADVLVTEGTVETWTIANESGKRRVERGSKVFVSDVAGPSAIVAAPAQIDRTLAWRSGEIVLDGETLAEAVAEFNRYNRRRLMIDPTLARKPLVGWFHTNDPETFAESAAMLVNASVVASKNEIHLVPKSRR